MWLVNRSFALADRLITPLDASSIREESEAIGNASQCFLGCIRCDMRELDVQGMYSKVETRERKSRLASASRSRIPRGILAFQGEQFHFDPVCVVEMMIIARLLWIVLANQMDFTGVRSQLTMLGRFDHSSIGTKAKRISDALSSSTSALSHPQHSNP